jgi:hypothetical protein
MMGFLEQSKKTSGIKKKAGNLFDELNKAYIF